MFFNWTYILILQGIILITFLLKHNQEEKHVTSKLFPTRTHFLIFNASIFIACYSLNAERQLYCIPVPWVTLLLILFCLSFLAFPLLQEQSKLLTMISVTCGLGVFISVYVFLFGWRTYLALLLLNIPIIIILHYSINILKKKFRSNVFGAFYFYPALILMPIFLLYQLGLILKSLNPLRSRLFILTPILTIAILFSLSFRMDYLVQEMKDNSNNTEELINLVNNPIDNYLIELVLGATWKYHTEICLYDGWRPPFHDPVLVSAIIILHSINDYDQNSNQLNAKELYKELYPDNDTIFECKCAKNERLIDM